jgi:hypothetical protein
VSYGTTSIFDASARRAGNSLPLALTIRSPATDGIIAHVAPPDLIDIERSLPLSVRACFRPAIVHVSPSRFTSTSGAPHSARGCGWVVALRNVVGRVWAFVG